MKLYLFLFTFFTSSFLLAQDVSDIVKEINDSKIEEDFILSENEFKECGGEDKTKKDYVTEVKDCVEAKVKELDEGKLEEFSQKYKLKSFNPDAAKSKETLKDYLSQRIQNALYGEQINENSNFKDMKFVNQEQFFELYLNQIGKNVLLEISRYALENYDRKDIVYDGSQFMKLGDANAVYFATQFSETQRCPKDPDYKVIDPKKDGCRDSIELKDIKDKQLTSAQSNPKLLGEHFIFMRGYIGEACEFYRCTHIYTDGVQNDVHESCKEKFNVTIDKNRKTSDLIGTSQKVPGQVACAVESKIKSYRKTLAKVEEMLNSFKNETHKKSGFAIGSTYKRAFSAGNADDKALDEITAISSKELVENVDDFNAEKLKAKGEEFTKECFDDSDNFNDKNENCVQNLTSKMSQEDMEKIELDQRVQTQVYLEELDKLAERAKNDKEELRKFLDKHGLSNKYPSLDKIDPKEIVEIIKGKYAAERLSLIENLKHKFERETSVKTADDIARFAEDQIEKNKEVASSVELLFNYSNIASSYLSTEEDSAPGGAKVFGENTIMRNIESQGFDEYAKDEKKNYDKFFEDDASKSSGSGVNVTLQFMDELIGNSAKKEE